MSTHWFEFSGDNGADEADDDEARHVGGGSRGRMWGGGRAVGRCLMFDRVEWVGRLRIGKECSKARTNAHRKVRHSTVQYSTGKPQYRRRKDVTVEWLETRTEVTNGTCGIYGAVGSGGTQCYLCTRVIPLVWTENNRQKDGSECACFICRYKSG